MTFTTQLLIAVLLLCACSSPRKQAASPGGDWTVFEWPEVVVEASPFREAEHGRVAIDGVRARPLEEAEIASLRVVFFDDGDGDERPSPAERLVDLTTTPWAESHTIEQGKFELRRVPRLMVEVTVELTSGRTRSAVWTLISERSPEIR